MNRELPTHMNAEIQIVSFWITWFDIPVKFMEAEMSSNILGTSVVEGI